ncbi:MAG: hypothetical protein KAS64_06620, partial [Spirochaetes bacterium]|nr:hypothetical protein [Spirochaetota bacterium]
MFKIIFISLFIFSCASPLYRNKNLNNFNNFFLNPGPIYNYKSYLKCSVGVGLSSEKTKKVYSIYHGKVYRLSNDPNNISNFGKFVEVLQSGTTP